MREGTRGEVRGKRLGGREVEVWGEERTGGKGRGEGRRWELEGEGERVREATSRLHSSQNFV